jgi:hypothetical protein
MVVMWGSLEGSIQGQTCSYYGTMKTHCWNGFPHSDPQSLSNQAAAAFVIEEQAIKRGSLYVLPHFYFLIILCFIGMHDTIILLVMLRTCYTPAR